MDGLHYFILCLKPFLLIAQQEKLLRFQIKPACYYKTTHPVAPADMNKTEEQQRDIATKAASVFIKSIEQKLNLCKSFTNA
jgi:hypothetical protein